MMRTDRPSAAVGLNGDLPAPAAPPDHAGALPRGIYNPYVSSKRSQISLMVGYDGTACHSRCNGTSPTTATVAEWISSPTPGPTKATPTTTLRCSSTTIRARPV